PCSIIWHTRQKPAQLPALYPRKGKRSKCGRIAFIWAPRERTSYSVGAVCLGRSDPATAKERLQALQQSQVLLVQREREGEPEIKGQTAASPGWQKRCRSIPRHPRDPWRTRDPAAGRFRRCLVFR